MKRHVQLPGVRKWSGNDLIDLQAEPFKALDGFFGQYGSMVLTGCQIVGKEIKPGIVVLPEIVKGVEEYKLATFKGAEVIQFPAYLTLKKITVSRDYENATVQPIAYDYEAVVVQNKPENTPYLAISEKDNRTFWSAIQNEYRRFVTDKQIEEWSTPRDFITSSTVDNLNEFKKSGFHTFECEGGEGTPIAGGFRGFSIIEEDEYFGTQVVFSTIRPEIFVRTLMDDEWGKWTKIWTSKSLRISKDNTVLGIKPFLPVRPAKGDAYMLNMNSNIFPRRVNDEGVLNELYRFVTKKKNNGKYFVGDSLLKLTDSNGNEIDMTERLLEADKLTLKKGDKITTDFISIISLENFFMIKGESLEYSKITIETYSLGSYINTVIPAKDFTDQNRETFSTTFSENVKRIRIKIEAIKSFTISHIHSFGFIENMSSSNIKIYRYDPDKGWQKENISGNVVHVKGRDYELRRDTFECSFYKIFTVNIPKIEYWGTDKDGLIHIKPIHSANRLVVRLYIKKRKSTHLSMRPKPKCVARYVEKTRYLANLGNGDVLSKRSQYHTNMLPYTVEEIYRSAFKFYPDGTIKRTNGMKFRTEHKDISDTHADIAMCFAQKVDGALVNGEMTYFRVQNGTLRNR